MRQCQQIFGMNHFEKSRDKTNGIWDHLTKIAVPNFLNTHIRTRYKL